MADIKLKLRLIHDDEYVEPMIFDSYKALATYAGQLDDSITAVIESEDKPEGEKEFLTNELSEKVQEEKSTATTVSPKTATKKATTSKKKSAFKGSFWDKLK